MKAETTIIENAELYDVKKIREDFPILKKLIHGKPLCYLDNAATSQKPQVVIDAINNFYLSQNANVHRGVHHLSEVSTKAFEDARIKIKEFINAASDKEIIFTRGTTEAINLVAYSYGRKNIREDDEIIISHMEHHSNIVPWQILCEEKKAKLKVIPVNDDGELILEEFEKLITDKTKLVAVVYISNSLGTINAVDRIIAKAHQLNIPVLLDSAQAISHTKIDVQKLDCDFLAFSGHKLYGPTGIGVLYGKEKLLDDMPPFLGGGDMIAKVTFEQTTYNELPYKFEAGTSNIAGAIGLGAAVDYVQKIGQNSISYHEQSLLHYATDLIKEIKGLKIIGTAKEKCSIISFVVDNIHPHDLGTFLDYEGIAIRTGHHCTQPLMHRFNIPATSRASFAMYNTKAEIDKFISALKTVIKEFS
ncbi:MAG: cysteine sulfinate desulfinase [Ignavibacteria bacterium RIFOXYB2_FULL_35_12]|nr:MAG: cysteine sulfinate desulfinase [Ignavibacteria bacterium GWA2_36_19]OGU52411.1 MAG: cysteine sulfinate desulfinase [Ignavibacteria bacterium GWC2_35_8]OGU62640.1 MAG: cysteine sulfinate desulfinase [Ignavibacteria bacterium GWF2_35_20]OGU82770.1 MAG: cysteine sulfinate desulfinase [Ignavibacteria bacterium RIFOXYA2_FULL_35_9]OGU88921.1 MAG: cysteine sulfinate desulfinase [Ignavibacteria bacterium RIFOXYC12_FULL_35_11]OGU89555.1 MAG: cysteine sulfinate desulfinase [Ignavibacteria bacter